MHGFFEEVGNSNFTIEGYDNHHIIQDKIRIGNGVTVTTLPDGETVLIRVFEATLLGEQANNLLYTLQLHKNWVDIDYRPRRHDGKSFFGKDGIIVPPNLTKVMITLNISKPSKFELNTCEVIEITKDEIWNPHLYSEDPINENYYIQLVSQFEDKLSVNIKLTSTSERSNHIKEHDAHFYIQG